jgi:hypothetical protein
MFHPPAARLRRLGIPPIRFSRVRSFGGFMGIGEDYYPLPWSLLTYNPRLESYEVNITDAQLKGAPKYSTGVGQPRPDD